MVHETHTTHGYRKKKRNTASVTCVFSSLIIYLNPNKYLTKDHKAWTFVVELNCTQQPEKNRKLTPRKMSHQDSWNIWLDSEKDEEHMSNPGTHLTESRTNKVILLCTC